MSASLPPSAPPRAAAAELRHHQEWLGFVQPVGLVVSIPALDKAQCYANRNIAREQAALRALAGDSDPPRILQFRALAEGVLGWEPTDLSEAPESLFIALPEYQEVLRPTWAVPDSEGGHQALVVEVPPGTALDKPRADTGWQASPEARIERLLRETGVPTGILFNADVLRLVYAPRGESAGHLTFRVADMVETAGRPILSGLLALLSAERLFNVLPSQRLPAILKDSRRYQNEVSTGLAEQVLDALHALLHGLQVANEAARGALLREVLTEARDEVYGGLLTTLLRLVFLLYAEDRGLLSADPIYVRNYAVTALFAKLRDDAARHPDAMDQRYGAWARLLTLFRLIHDGGGHGTLRLPPRYGRLFDPDVYPFLEGRPHRSRRVQGEGLSVPRISDGVVYRVLDKLLVLRGERLSYSALDVEHIGSVYEAMMGFTLEAVTEPSIAVRPHHVIVGLASLLKQGGAERLKALSDAGCKVSGKAQDAVKQAKSHAELVSALGKSVSPRTPEILPVETLVLQPTEERRRSGSHYTPRALTEPIVATTLRPIFEAMGPDPEPGAILDLKLCDPAMGSGAFLVAACRALGDKLVASWQKHGAPAIPPDEDPVLHARRLVAQRCLYGVDKNPFAVDLAKLSLWLVTLAKEHPFTFLDHALRRGDSLVGLGRKQISCVHWEESGTPIDLVRGEVEKAVEKAVALRLRIHEMGDSDDVSGKRQLHEDAEAATAYVRYVGDQVIEAFFAGKNDKERKARLTEVAKALVKPGETIPEHKGRSAFHWEIEFPEVFARENPGFDAFVGNPPFMGGAKIWPELGEPYRDWLLVAHEESNAKADIVAHFFRRGFLLTRIRGTLGMIATNSIAQGATRDAGLRWIREHGGWIYAAHRRFAWPLAASVIVSVVHFLKRGALEPCVLDGRRVDQITAFLFHTGPDRDPARLNANAKQAFLGCKIYGQGFLFDDEDSATTPLSEMRRLQQANPKNHERIFPYVGGEDLNSSPTQSSMRYAINFADMPIEAAQQWPDLLRIVEERVKPVRARLGGYSVAEGRNERWWQYGTYTPTLYAALAPYDRALAIARVSSSFGFCFVPTRQVLNEKIVVFAFDDYPTFCVMQSRSHAIWARLLNTTLKDDMQYSSQDCFETFPFPPDWQQDATLEAAGKTYYEFRAALMIANNQGLTATYNRFHDPDETSPEILRLRELHAAMDRAVLDAYGWTDIQPACAFLLDYEEPEDEDEAPRARAKKKPWRYRWPDETRDEVLARLLALNAERAAEEKRLGEEAVLAAKAEKKAKPAPKGRAKKKGDGGGDGQGSLF